MSYKDLLVSDGGRRMAKIVEGEDVDSLLEAPYKGSHKAGSRGNERDADYSKVRKSRSGDASRSPSQSQKKGDTPYDWSPSSDNSSPERENRSRKKSSRDKSDQRLLTSHKRPAEQGKFESTKRRPSRSRSRSPDRRRRSSKTPDRRHSSSRHEYKRKSPSPRRHTQSPLFRKRPISPERRPQAATKPEKVYPRVEDMTIEDRDARTVFCMQISPRASERDIRDFFESVGKIRDIRIICDPRTKKSKGICYVEFYDVESVPLALGLNGQRLKGAPIMIQVTQSEKNILFGTGYSDNRPSVPTGPMKLYVGNLHFNIDEEMIRSIFEPFGKIDRIEMLKDVQGGRSRGYCFLTFRSGEDAKKAMEQMNGFELAGREIKVNYVTDHAGMAPVTSRNLDSDDIETAGMPLGATGRLHLMAKLAEGTGLQLPAVSQQLLQQHTTAAVPPISSQCFMLSNMFDPKSETEKDWDKDVKDDVVAECSRHGGVVHVFVDKQSPQGNVYCKCPTIAVAVSCVNSLHGRLFAGKIITANYVPVANYHQLFSEAMQAVVPLAPLL